MLPYHILSTCSSYFWDFKTFSICKKIKFKFHSMPLTTRISTCSPFFSSCSKGNTHTMKGELPTFNKVVCHFCLRMTQQFLRNLKDKQKKKKNRTFLQWLQILSCLSNFWLNYSWVKLNRRIFFFVLQAAGPALLAHCLIHARGSSSV